MQVGRFDPSHSHKIRAVINTVELGQLVSIHDQVRLDAEEDVLLGFCDGEGRENVNERACNDVVVGGVSRGACHRPAVLHGHMRLPHRKIVLASLSLAIHITKIDLGCNCGVLFEIVHGEQRTIL